MKTFTKRILTTLILITIISLANAQTNVSGGIYSNTTWTKVNSPYIVTDTVVVFVNDTLTIEPGVTVKFDNKMMIEIRGVLNAIGTSSDSIIFTSNSTTPTPGIYAGLYLIGPTSQFNYCSFTYANTCINSNNSGTYSIMNSNFYNNSTVLNFVLAHINACHFISNNLVMYDGYGSSINNCSFMHNTVVLDGVSETMTLNYDTLMYNSTVTNEAIGGTIRNCLVDSNGSGIYFDGSPIENCVVTHNQYGIITDDQGGTVIRNCTIDNNGTGVELGGKYGPDSLINCQIKNNGIGLVVHAMTHQGDYDIITQNVIESDSIGIQLEGGGYFKLYCNRICNNTAYDAQNLTGGYYNISNNYWCTTDSIIIATRVYDGYDNISLGLITFMPVDSVCSPGALTSVNEITPVNSFRIYPNPATDYLTVELLSNSSKTTIKIFNMLGELEYSSTAATQKTNIDVSTLSSGIHFIEVSADDKSYWKKFIRE